MDAEIPKDLDAIKLVTSNSNKLNRKAGGGLLKQVEKQWTKLSEESKKVYSKYQHICKTYLDFHKFKAKDKDSLANFFYVIPLRRINVVDNVLRYLGVVFGRSLCGSKNAANFFGYVNSNYKKSHRKKEMVFGKDQMKKIFSYLENKIKQRGFERYKA